MTRRPLLLLAALALVVVVAVGLVQTSGQGGGSEVDVPDRAEVAKLLAGAPAPLANLHARSNALLAAGTAKAELAALKGYPVVVNKWGSWCNPCRAEFPVLQQVSAELGTTVAFLGLDVSDSRGDAARFLAKNPVSYPSLYDPKLDAAQALEVASAFNPATVFYDRAGKQTYIHQGQYVTAEELKADIARYTRG